MADAETDYVKGEMDVAPQASMFDGFVKVTAWASLILILVIGYATFTLTMGMNWMVAMGLFAIVGVAAGLFMGMGSSWIITLIGLIIVGVFVQFMIFLGGALMG